MHIYNYCDILEFLSVYKTVICFNVVVSDICKKSKTDYTGVDASQMETAKHLFETVSSVLGSSLRSHISPAANFFALGGNSLNAIYTISKLADLGYFIGKYITRSVNIIFIDLIITSTYRYIAYNFFFY